MNLCFYEYQGVQENPNIAETLANAPAVIPVPRSGRGLVSREWQEAIKGLFLKIAIFALWDVHKNIISIINILG